MDINQFYNYKNRCPHCDKFLINIAEFNVAVYRDTTNEFSLIGSILYDYDGCRFNKMNYEVYKDIKPSDEHIQKHKVMSNLAKITIDSFKVNKRVFPNLNAYRYLATDGLVHLSADFLIFDMRLQSSCISKRHIYYYQTSTILPGAKQKDDVISIDSEMISIYGYRIFNAIDSNKPSTVITKNYSSKTSEYYELPLIPIDRWKTSNKETLTRQIQSYNILK